MVSRNKKLTSNTSLDITGVDIVFESFDRLSKCESDKKEIISLKSTIDSLKFSNKQLTSDIQVLKLIVENKQFNINRLNQKDKQWIAMYNDLMAKHESVKSKWWYKLFTKLESWIKAN